MPEFHALGATLVAISPQLREFNQAVSEKRRLNYDILADPGNRVATQFGISYPVDDKLRQLYLSHGVDLRKYNGDDSWTLPMPARFVMDAAGTIRYVSINPDYRDRAEPADTVAALRNGVLKW